MYYRFDPSGFRPPTAWLAPLIHMLNAAGIVRSEDVPVADGILLSSHLGSLRHEVTMLEIQAFRHKPRKLIFQRLKMVLVLHAPGQFAQLRESLATMLAHYSGSNEIDQSEIELPGDRFGLRYRADHWPPWLMFEWTADAQRFYFAIGEGTLEQWFASNQPMAEHADFTAHRRQVKALPQAPRFFEMFADLERLREAVPSLFRVGRTTPILRLFELDKADQWMLHGRWSDTFLIFDVTTLQKDGYSHRNLSLDHWPVETNVSPPNGRFHVVAPINWPEAVSRTIDTVRLVYKSPKRPRFDRSMKQYHQKTGIDLADFASTFQPYLLLSDYPKSWLAIPGTATVYMSMKDEVQAPAVHAQFRRLMEPLLSNQGEDPHGAAVPDELIDHPPTLTHHRDDLGVAHDSTTGLYWLDSPMRQLFKAPAWGWSNTRGGDPGRILIGSYSPTAVLQNRQFQSSHLASRDELRLAERDGYSTPTTSAASKSP